MDKKIPNHIAIIMDGNGRWAKNRLLPRIAGHRAGTASVRGAIEACVRNNIKILTLFAFSSENWQRPAKEINYLMKLFLRALKNEVKKLHQQNIKFKLIGDRDALNESLQAEIKRAEDLTVNNTGLTLVIATNYGGRWDVVEACRHVAAEVEAGNLKSAEIQLKHIQKYIQLNEFPEPDLFIRTSGEQRISNFMLWQLAYTELYFTNVLWPDFTEKDLEQALDFYNNRERRFGCTGEQIQNQSREKQHA